MSGPLEASRADLASALGTGGYPATLQPGGVWTAPATLLEGASPWATEHTRDGSVLVAWRVHVVPGRLDFAGSWDGLVARADAIRAIIRAMPGWIVGPTSNPREITTDDGGRYLSAEIAASAHYPEG